MTTPAGPSWLDTDAVAAWLTRNAATADADLIEQVAASVEPFCEAARPEFRDDAGVYVPDAEVEQAAIMLACRVLRRRNSPGGVETFSDGIVQYVARFDPEIERALRIGGYQAPRIG